MKFGVNHIMHQTLFVLNAAVTDATRTVSLMKMVGVSFNFLNYMKLKLVINYG